MKNSDIISTFGFTGIKGGEKIYDIDTIWRFFKELKQKILRSDLVCSWVNYISMIQMKV